MVTVVMYHFVRDLTHSRYPGIKGIDVNKFNQQVKFLTQKFTPIRVEDLIESIYANKKLPENAVLLTFDDAYIDHYTNVFPILDYHKVQGAFYAPVRAILENKVLDVNKIHFVLAASSTKEIIDEIRKFLKSENCPTLSKTFDEYYSELAIQSRFDTEEVIFIKRLLQRELPEETRKMLVDELFKKFIQVDEKAFSRELYMNENQYKLMIRKGMHFGGHSFDHFWLNSLSNDDQEIQISKTKDFLNYIGVNNEYLTFCYPYGAHNENSVDLLSAYNFKLAFTTEVNTLDTNSYFNPFKIPRLDTNDIEMND